MVDAGMKQEEETQKRRKRLSECEDLSFFFGLSLVVNIKREELVERGGIKEEMNVGSVQQRE